MLQSISRYSRTISGTPIPQKFGRLKKLKRGKDEKLEVLLLMLAYVLTMQTDSFAGNNSKTRDNVLGSKAKREIKLYRIRHLISPAPYFLVKDIDKRKDILQ